MYSITIEFDHPTSGVFSVTTTAACDEAQLPMVLDGLLTLPEGYDVVLNDGVIYAAVPGDALTDIGSYRKQEG